MSVSFAGGNGLSALDESSYDGTNGVAYNSVVALLAWFLSLFGPRAPRSISPLRVRSAWTLSGVTLDILL